MAGYWPSSLFTFLWTSTSSRPISSHLDRTSLVNKIFIVWQAIDQASSVKMAGYWPRSLFTFLWTSTSSRSIKTQKDPTPTLVFS